MIPPLVQPTHTKMDAVITAENTLNQVIAVIGKKIGKLEKRKRKLDGFRENKRRGKELNKDQKIAVNKYDEVLDALNFIREVQAQLATLVIEETTARKERQENARTVVVERFASMLAVKEILSYLWNGTIRKELIQGRSVTHRVSPSQFKQLYELRDILTPDQGKGSFKEQCFTSAVHLLDLVERKDYQVPGMEEGVIYKDLAELLDTLDGFEDKTENEAEDTVDNDTSKNEQEEDIETIIVERNEEFVEVREEIVEEETEETESAAMALLMMNYKYNFQLKVPAPSLVQHEYQSQALHGSVLIPGQTPSLILGCRPLCSCWWRPRQCVMTPRVV